MISTYFQITLSQVTAEEEDSVVEFCFEGGAAGVSEDLEFHQSCDNYEPEVIDAEVKRLKVYFTDRPGEEFFQALRENFSSVNWQISEEENRDWLQEWKKGLKPFHLAGPFWIVPSWCRKPQEARKAIFIDPGMAFGTGTHATTQLAAQFIVDVVSSVESPSLIDVGTGTGILAFVGRLQGASRVVATEIDSEARRVARENAVLNDLSEVEIVEAPVEKLTERFDLVIANIIDGILLRLKAALIARLKPGGHMILTGILQERARDFEEEFLRGTCLEVLERRQQDEWVGLLLKSPGE